GLLTASARTSTPPTTSACKRCSPAPFDPRSRTGCPAGGVARPDPLPSFQATAVLGHPLHPPASLARRSAPPGARRDRSPIHGQQALLTGAAPRQRQQAGDHGELLRLRFEEPLPRRALAARWGVPAAGVHRAYARARQEFRAALLEGGGLPSPRQP